MPKKSPKPQLVSQEDELQFHDPKKRVELADGGTTTVREMEAGFVRMFPRIQEITNRIKVIIGEVLSPEDLQAIRERRKTIKESGRLLGDVAERCVNEIPRGGDPEKINDIIVNLIRQAVFNPRERKAMH